MQTQQPTLEPDYRFVTLDQLVESDGNVATIGRDQVEDLIASIGAHGLQQGLVVKEAGKKLKVSAGKRRHLAIRLLHESGRWPAERQIPVAVVHKDASEAEVSATENLSRKDMHPVDEFAAFKKLVEQEGLTTQDLMARFGRDQRYIEQRLKLANVSPKLLELLKADKIKLAQVMALAITDNHAEQERVWKAAERSNWAGDKKPESLQKQLTSKELQVGEDRLATFLGADDYNAGGGEARRDLFSDAVWLPDSKLVRKLANEKLQAIAKKDHKDEGWAWMEPRLEFGYEEKQKFGKYGADKYGYVDTTKTDWPAKAKEIAGMVVTIGGDGEVEVHRGLIRPEDMKKAAAAGKAKSKGTGAAAEKKPAKKPGQLSFATIQRLQGDRTAVLRKVLSTDRRRALAALAADLYRDSGIGESRAMLYERTQHKIVRLGEERPFVVPQQINAALEQHPYTKEMDKAEKEWAAKLKPGKDDLFAWLLAQKEDLTLDLLAFLTARAVVAGQSHQTMKDDGAAFASTAGVDMAQHWAPTKAWLESQPTAIAIEAVTEVKGKLAAAELEKLPGKAAKVARAAELLKGSGWIPKELRQSSAKPAANASPKKAPARKAPAKKPARKSRKK